MQEIRLYDNKFKELIQGKIKGAILEPKNEEEDIQPKVQESLNENQRNLSCSYCNAEFANVDQQREHYKLDWHRYNLKQSLLSRPAITEEQFSEKTDDLSSISGSDSEKEDTLDILATSLGKVFLKDETGRVFSIYRALLVDRKIDIDMSDIQKQLQDIQAKNRWAILMLGGGHFAGAVFQGDDPILHKTFHCYTVRAGQGGSQSSRDNKGAVHASAGSSMRRYNEQAFVQYVAGIVEAWQKEMFSCSLIFYRAAGTYNKSILFGGKSPLLDKSDNRLRSIPFSTRRATFTEVKRVHSLLSTISVFDKLENASKHINKYKPSETKRSKTKSSPINRAKSREPIERPLPGECNFDSDEDNTKFQSKNKPNNNKSSDESVEFETCNLEISFQECLGSFEETRRPKYHKKQPKQKSKTKAEKIQEAEIARKQELCDVIAKGELDVLKNILKTYEENDGKINEALDKDQNTLLHLSCLKNQKEILLYLLELGADVCAKNKSHQTPYSCMQIKEMREVLKHFAQENPEKYNYNKAQIPVVDNKNSEEIAEKKRLQKKLKREKEKEKKKEKEVLRKEEVEQNKFAALSDREKRALAAERRILGLAGTVIARCFLCGADISGKVPFEYSGNRFCSVECLKAHRIKNPVVLS